MIIHGQRIIIFEERNMGMGNKPVSLLVSLAFVVLTLLAISLNALLLEHLVQVYGMEVGLQIDAGFFAEPTGDPALDFYAI